jgi:hypothetical protein
MPIHGALLTKPVTEELVVTFRRLAQFALYFAHLRERCVCTVMYIRVCSHSLDSKLIVNENGYHAREFMSRLTVLKQHSKPGNNNPRTTTHMGCKHPVSCKIYLFS